VGHGHFAGWLAGRARLINRDSSAPMLIMQELLVSGGVPQQKLHCCCISNRASAGVMGFHTDKAFWLFVILKRHLNAERWQSGEVRREQRRAKPALCQSQTYPCLSISRNPCDCWRESSGPEVDFGEGKSSSVRPGTTLCSCHSTVGRGDEHTAVLLSPASSSFTTISLEPL